MELQEVNECLLKISSFLFLSCKFFGVGLPLIKLTNAHSLFVTTYLLNVSLYFCDCYVRTMIQYLPIEPAMM